MMTMKTPEQDPADTLAPYFAAARAKAPAPSDELMARVMADAAAVQQGRIGAGQPRAGVLARVSAALVPLAPRRPLAGGLGMAGVALCGLWLGFAAPGPLGQVEALLWGSAGPDAELELLLAELTPDFGDLP